LEARPQLAQIEYISIFFENNKRPENSKVGMGGIEKKKIWTGILLVPPVFLLVIFGPPSILVGMVLLATFLGLREFFELTLPQSKSMERLGGIGLGLGLSLLIGLGKPSLIPLYFAFLLFFLSILFMATSQNLLTAIFHMAVTLFGILYVGFLLSHVSLIRNLAGGRHWTLFLIVTVWAGDISAFVSGSLLGRHKLYPKISPKKTYEGLGVSSDRSRRSPPPFIPDLGKGLCLRHRLRGSIGRFHESMLKRSASGQRFRYAHPVMGHLIV
jgi:phosphatidate cytidylyltransferase